MNWTAGGLALPLESLDPNASCKEVFDWFAARGEQPAAVLLRDDGSIAGLVNRLHFLALYARRFYPEVYSRRSILKLANRNPLIVDENVRVTDLSASVVDEHPQALSECFIVTRAGRYLGIGTGEALMRSKVALLQWSEAELHRALRAAEYAVQAKSNFLALMSHELRTPLNAIIGFSQVLDEELFGPIGQPRYREYAADIQAAGRHLLALINDILDLTKAEVDKIELNESVIDPAELMDDCLRLVRDRANKGLLLLELRIDPALRDVGFYADQLRIKQVILNLLSNAIKFTRSGGRVTLNAQIEVDGGLSFAVHDTGIGMTEDQIPLALEPFRQIDSPLVRNFEGSGLGLALVKALVERHEGSLTLTSEPNVGTLVSVQFGPQRTRALPAAQAGFSKLKVSRSSS
jgi:two-component system cell cycle sensor histidine kinase PleC